MPDNPYLGGTSGRSTEQVVWGQLLDREWAEPVGHLSAAVLLDLKKAFEYVCHLVLVQWCRAINFPMQTVRCCVCLYTCTRTLVMEGHYG